MAPSRRKVWLVQQGVWQMPKASMPLAAGYLKATLDHDQSMRRELDVRIFNFGGSEPIVSMAQQLFQTDIPDMLAFSVLGWNYRAFGILAGTFKQLNPEGTVVFGGTHVANQAKRVFHDWPAVDVLVNGEGEFPSLELVSTILLGGAPYHLDQIAGISYRRDDGSIITTPSRERIANLDDIPSPILSGAIPLVDASGDFLYDVALLETNRGCPYHCAFCYWGGAVGQKIRAFSRDRLRAEVEWIAQHRAPSLFLCDSNFGMLEADEQFVEDVIRIREHYGYPRALESSWAKNKSKRFYDIVRRMKDAGLRSSFTLSLQTLNPTALELMQRRNMRLNEWEELVRWLHDEGMDCFAELIWGAPGETPESFLEGYDRLAKHVSRIATYPLLLLPNTAYSENRERYGFITVRGDRDDFEYVLAHSTLSMREAASMQRFVLWSRALAEHGFFRHIWTALRGALDMPQSKAILSAADYVEQCGDKRVSLWGVPPARLLQPDSFQEVLRELYGNPALQSILDQWWQDEILPQAEPRWRDLLAEIHRYDCLTRPIYDPGGIPVDSGVEQVEVAGEAFYRRRCVPFRYDIPRILKELASIGEECEVAVADVAIDMYYRIGFAAFIDTQELVPRFVGMERDEVLSDVLGPMQDPIDSY